MSDAIDGGVGDEMGCNRIERPASTGSPNNEASRNVDPIRKCFPLDQIQECVDCCYARLIERLRHNRDRHIQRLRIQVIIEPGYRNVVRNANAILLQGLQRAGCIVDLRADDGINVCDRTTTSFPDQGVHRFNADCFAPIGRMHDKRRIERNAIPP